jgi:hypothetical protein
MAEIDFKFGSLIRTGPQLVYGGKWDADLVDWRRNAKTNADLTIYIRVHFTKIDPPGNGPTGLYGDNDDKPDHPSKKTILRWRPGEFERFTRNLVAGAQRFWDGAFWLKTPRTYNGLDYSEAGVAHRCNLYCRFRLEHVRQPGDAHYTIPVVKVPDGGNFRSNSALFRSTSIQGEHRIPNSTVKFWAYFHEVGHLLGLSDLYPGGGILVTDRGPKPFPVPTKRVDVMWEGSVRHVWDALPWQQAAEQFTGCRANEWHVSQHHIHPERL